MSVDSMTASGLKLPKRMLALIESGVLPRTGKEAMRLDLEPLVSLERIHRFAPEENRIVFYPPPFVTIAEQLGGDMLRYWTEFGALNEIIPELIVPLGDFGIGSDTAVALDYRADRDNPAVIRLLWRQPGQPNTWVRCADSFDEFASMLGLRAGH
jgi:hypothetical protein